MIERKGTTLVELVLSMMAGSAVMLLGISLVHQSMSLNEKSRSRTDDSRTLDRLAQFFRQDIHLATKVNIDDQGTLTLTYSDVSEVTYTLQNHFLVRNRENATGDFDKEQFALSDDSISRFARLQNPDRVSLIVSRDSGLPSDASRLDLKVECLLGRWQLLEQGERGRNETAEN